MRVLVTSDFHGHLPGTLPETDMLIIAGDVCPSFNPSVQAAWLPEFADWLDAQMAEWIVGVAGNWDHSLAFARLPWEYLDNEAREVGGVKTWGTRECSLTMRENKLAALWRTIPDDTEIVVAHGPAHGLNDLAQGRNLAGSKSLRERLLQLRDLRLIVTGHIHEAYGTDGLIVNGRWVPALNGSWVDERYTPGNPPLMVELDTSREKVSA